jgi:periplasmic divalent cation tolerance protein
MSDYIQVVTTIDDQQAARRLARELLERRLAGCVQISTAVESHYWWQGQIETSAEWCLVIKSRRDRYWAIEATIRQLHSYATPEILCLPIVDGSREYLAWLAAELEVPPASGR